MSGQGNEGANCCITMTFLGDIRVGHPAEGGSVLPEAPYAGQTGWSPGGRTRRITQIVTHEIPSDGGGLTHRVVSNYEYRFRQGPCIGGLKIDHVTCMGHRGCSVAPGSRSSHRKRAAYRHYFFRGHGERLLPAMMVSQRSRARRASRIVRSLQGQASSYNAGGPGPDAAQGCRQAGIEHGRSDSARRRAPVGRARNHRQSDAPVGRGAPAGGRRAGTTMLPEQASGDRGMLEVRGGIEPPYADLQSAASPLCHRTQGAARYRVRARVRSSPGTVKPGYGQARVVVSTKQVGATRPGRSSSLRPWSAQAREERVRQGRPTSPGRG